MTCSASCIVARFTPRFTAELGEVCHRLSHDVVTMTDLDRFGHRSLLIRRGAIVTLPIVRGAAPSNSTVKLLRPGFGPPAEPAALLPARRRHGGCRSRLSSANVIRGNRRAAAASARGTGRTAYREGR
jgi:hypothetical protein